MRIIIRPGEGPTAGQVERTGGRVLPDPRPVAERPRPPPIPVIHRPGAAGTWTPARRPGGDRGKSPPGRAPGGPPRGQEEPGP